MTVCFALAAAGAVTAQHAAAPDVQLIRDREQQRVKYLVTGDIERVAQMTSPTLSYSHSNGSIDGREKYLNDLRTRQVVFHALDHRDVNIRFVTPQVAVLNGLSDVKVTVGAQELSMTLRFTIVYVEKNGEWLFEAWQSSRVAS